MCLPDELFFIKLPSLSLIMLFFLKVNLVLTYLLQIPFFFLIFNALEIITLMKVGRWCNRFQYMDNLISPVSSVMRFSVLSWVSFGSLYVFQNLSVLPRLSNLLVYSCSRYSLILLLISVKLAIMSSLSDFNCLCLPSFFLLSLTKSLSMLLIFSGI